MARHRLTGPGPGRPKGSVNKNKLALGELLRDIGMSPEYQDSLRARAVKGDTVLDKEILARILGAVPKIVQVKTPAPLVVDMVTGPDGSDRS